MSRRYLLDTNVLSALVKRPASGLAERIAQMDREDFCTSIIVACELRYGAGKKGSAALTERVEQVLARLDVIPLDSGVDRCYAEVRVALERIGQPIGHNDLLIAAHALALGVVLVTANVSELSRVPGLTVENWLSEDV
jgi:tRNA(fMet)-specific endonuclease VapC